MKFKSPEASKKWEEGLDHNLDDYGNAVYRYASEWATRMEAEMDKGNHLKDVADRTSHEADDEGITGFMFGCAVSLLAKLWIHSEELRRWHNLHMQIVNEGEKANESGGVLNPAILNIGPK
jgi:hypothetical protein